jgi:hypothetical protein
LLIFPLRRFVRDFLLFACVDADGCAAIQKPGATDSIRFIAPRIVISAPRAESRERPIPQN